MVNYDKSSIHNYSKLTYKDIEDAISEIIKLEQEEDKITHIGDLYQYKCGDYIIHGNKDSIEKFVYELDKRMLKELKSTNGRLQ